MESRRVRKSSRSSGDGIRASLPAPPSSKSASRERIKSAPQLAEEAQKLKQTSSRWTSLPGGHSTARFTLPPSSPSTRKSSGSWDSASRTTTVDGKVPSGLQEVVIAVLGPLAVGKSTFTELALDLKKAPVTPISSKKVSLEGLLSVIRLVEVDVDDVDIVGEHLHWPERVGDQPTPAIDGVLLMYNVLDPSTTADLPPLLGSLNKARIPTIVVATHCDNSPRTWRADYEKIEKFATKFTGVECFQTSVDISETHKRCVSIILRNVMHERHGKQPEAIAEQLQAADPFKSKQSSSPFSVSSPATDDPPKKLPGQSAPRDHVGAESGSGTVAAKRDEWTISAESPLLNPTNTEEDNLSEHNSDPSDGESEDEAAGKSPSLSKEDSTTLTNSSLDVSSLEIADKRSDSKSADHNRSKSDNASSLSEVKPNTTRRERGSDASGAESRDTGSTFGELVDRLLMQPMSKADSNYAATFLCLYRKIAAPSELLSAIISRFEAAAAMEVPTLVQMTSQLRYLAIVRDWVADYPGDFAHLLTRRMIMSFMQSLVGNRAFAVAHKEISQHLEVIFEDDDTSWACSDKGRSRASTMESFLTKSSAHSAASTVTADSSTEDIPDQDDADKGFKKSTRVPSASSGASGADSQTSGAMPASLQSVESAQRQAQLLNPAPKITLDKIRWHQLMDTPDEQIARELTRIDWIMYSSIRPRDLVRHISLSAEQKDSCKSLEHVNRIINQFNHIAFWVAHWVLLRDKPKHRAKALEKFMNVAWKLRHLNNYNSLGAVVAGINSTAVHRLTQTRDLINAETQKQFMRLEILMGTQKSHFAYRLAWENTSSARIPFLPLHRRDLVLAEEANKTYIPGADGDLINWKKFELMGQVILEIRKSQQQPYTPIRRNEEVQRLLLDGAFSKEDDELYERSVQVEKPGAGEQPRRKFNLFTR